MIDIVKASAGSGKTFKLAKTFISLLFKSDDRFAYRHILAVTFTNKATEEMKSRIIKELDVLARNPEKSGYFKDFSKEFGNAEQISNRAENILFDILHDYSSFSVCTIDKFVQMTLKSFARELGQFSTYQVELDKDSLVEESVDRILDSLTEDETDLLGWLTDSAMSQLENGKRANVAESLYGMAKALKSEAHRSIVEKNSINEDLAYSRNNLTEVRKVCNAYLKSFRVTVREAAETALRVFDECGVNPTSTSYGFAKALYKYVGVDGKELECPSEPFMRRAMNKDEWFSKKNAQKMLDQLGGRLDEPMGKFVGLFTGEGYSLYNTAEVIVKQVFSLGIASELKRSFDDLMKEKNVINLDDSNTMLRKIIDGSDAPFIYEKMGVRFQNFLLDEFQDTSAVQWDNFKPLVKESDSNGNANLIVGDVKQSIYRWRGSDWHLLDSGIKSDFPDADDEGVKQQNWRSLYNVVDFNNRFFAYAAGRLDALNGTGGEVARIYKDVEQEIMVGRKGEGRVELTFCDSNLQKQVVLDSISSAVTDGKADYGQIAVLVRTHSDGAEVASWLVGAGVPVISDDSLYVKSSLVVRRLVSLLHHVDNKDDSIGGYLAKSLDIETPKSYKSLFSLSEELLRGLMRTEGDSLDSEVNYVQSFMDEIQDWSASNGNNLGEFLRHWDGVNPVIASPDDTNAVRIITVHKAKGLEFPYVIFPKASSVEMSRAEEQWCCPDLSGTELEAGAPLAYSVSLSSRSESSLFKDDYKRNTLHQVVDNFNTLYVALTRAGSALHVIADRPGEDPKCMADLLYEFVSSNKEGYEYKTDEADSEHAGSIETFALGVMPDFSASERKTDSVIVRPATYKSFPLNPEAGDSEQDVRERGRLKFSADSVEFFSDEKSPRLKGVVLHDILSSVVVPSDLEAAVASRVRHGELMADEAARYQSLLEERISSAQAEGWFPEDRTMVENEVSLVDVDGSLHRPDRVVSDGSSVTIIDYKFGAENQRYMSQIRRYADLYKAMGYTDVKACLWYVFENKIVYLPFDKQ